MTTVTRPVAGSRPPPQHQRGLPTPMDATDDVVWQEVDREFRRYDRQARQHRIGYLTLRLVVLVVGAVVTVLAAVDADPAVTAALAALVVVAEGAQQLFQLHTRWISYRTAAETLRCEAFLYVAGLPPYEDPATRRPRLAAVLQDVRSGEYGTWLRTMREDTSPAHA